MNLANLKQMSYEPLKCWAFAWTTGSPRPYITHLTGWTRRDCTEEVQKAMGEPWLTTYRRGGRIIRCVISQQEPKP